MELYYMLGKGLIGVFVGLANLLSPAPSPMEKPLSPIAVIAPMTIATSAIAAPIKLLEPVVSTSTARIQRKPIPIYLNYPEKVAISPVKTIDVNFNKIFQYSLQTPQTRVTTSVEPQKNTSPITIPTPSSISSEEKIKNSVVNIYCSIQNGRNIKVVTGSGVVIDPRGIVLTNAHVGQFPLLQSSSIASNMSCSVRTGSPVNKTYGVKTLYVSKDWISTNYRNISQINFSETGEGDIAILQIVDKTTEKSLGEIFDYFPLANSVPAINDQISIASYPADILGISGINSLLVVQTEQLRVGDAYSFSYNVQPDLIETSDSLQAQHGSSGGAILNSDDRLTGLIAITVSGNNPLMKHVRALTIPHISAVVQKDTGYSLNSFLLQDINDISSRFESTKQNLILKLIDGSAGLFFQQ